MPLIVSWSVGRFTGCVDRGTLGETEVENLHTSIGGDEDVLGFEIAMDDAAGVGGREACHHLMDQLDGTLERDGPRSMRTRRVSPSSSSVTKNGTSLNPTSKIAMTFGATTRRRRGPLARTAAGARDPNRRLMKSP